MPDLNAAPDQRSLLDQIHDVMALATKAGMYDAADWMRKHADEPCPAAIAQAVGMEPLHAACGKERTASDGDVHCNGDCDTFNHGEPDGCHKFDPSAPDPARTAAMRGTIAAISKHSGCWGDASLLNGCAYLENPSACAACKAMHPLLAALAATEKRAKEARDAQRQADEYIAGQSRVITSQDATNAALTRKLATAREVLTELLRLYDWRLALAREEDGLATPARRPFTTEEISRSPEQWAARRKQMERDLRKYGREKRAAWVAARDVLLDTDGNPEDENCGCTVFVWCATHLAAIDAPAPIPPGGKCPECDATTYGTREVHLLDCSRADAPIEEEGALTLAGFWQQQAAWSNATFGPANAHPLSADEEREIASDMLNRDDALDRAASTRPDNT